jgi:hypothetical protein
MNIASEKRLVFISPKQIYHFTPAHLEVCISFLFENTQFTSTHLKYTLFSVHNEYCSFLLHLMHVQNAQIFAPPSVMFSCTAEHDSRCSFVLSEHDTRA